VRADSKSFVIAHSMFLRKRLFKPLMSVSIEATLN
jgi:hypothetical protein